MEQQLTKRRIIELYLNVAEMGDGVFVVEAAALNYYGKHASQLNAREAATLASVLPNPRRYKPNGTSRYVENQSERIYRIMMRRGIVIPEYEEVINDTKYETTKDKDVPAVIEQKIEEKPVVDQTETKTDSISKE